MGKKDRDKDNMVVMPKKAYNQLVKLLKDEEYIKLIDERQSVLSKLPQKLPTREFVRDTRKAIKKYVEFRSLPSVWELPIYNMMTGKHEVDFPLHNSISLRVGLQEITGATPAVLKVKNIKTGLLDEERSISIVITSKVSADQVIKFIKENKDEIEEWQEFYELPEYKNPTWKRTNLALEIIKMRDKQGMTFPEISEKLTNNLNLTKREHNLVSDYQYLRRTYRRFKKYLKS